MLRDSPEQTWEDEAQAVIKDISQHVKEIAISSAIESSKSKIYLNLRTLEDQPYCIELSSLGFRVVAKRFDSIEEDDLGPSYDTPYALLTQISPAFPRDFAEKLRSKLEVLRDEGEFDADEMDGVDD